MNYVLHILSSQTSTDSKPAVLFHFYLHPQHYCLSSDQHHLWPEILVPSLLPSLFVCPLYPKPVAHETSLVELCLWQCWFSMLLMNSGINPRNFVGATLWANVRQPPTRRKRQGTQTLFGFPSPVSLHSHTPTLLQLEFLPSCLAGVSLLVQ